MGLNFYNLLSNLKKVVDKAGLLISLNLSVYRKLYPDDIIGLTIGILLVNKGGSGLCLTLC